MSDCILWKDGTNPNEYGRLHRTAVKGLAHRVAYEEAHGTAIPKGFDVHHTCRVRACINPAHLELLEHKEHAKLYGRAAKTHCKHGHPFDEENTIKVKGGRACRACKRRMDKEAYRERRAA